MAPLQTHRAHCGACAGEMVMRIGVEGIWFICLKCDVETPPRMTAAEADDDVVWVPVEQKEQTHGKLQETDSRRFYPHLAGGRQR